MENKNKLLIVLIVIFAIFIILITVNKISDSSNNNQKPETPVVEPDKPDDKPVEPVETTEQKALRILREKTGDETGNYTFVETDSDGNSVFTKEGDELKTYIVNAETGEYSIKVKSINGKGASQ